MEGKIYSNILFLGANTENHKDPSNGKDARLTPSLRDGCCDHLRLLDAGDSPHGDHHPSCPQATGCEIIQRRLQSSSSKTSSLISQEEYWILEEDWINYELANYFVLSINTFTCLSSPINLSVYCGMSKQFRDELRQLMTRYTIDISFNE